LILKPCLYSNWSEPHGYKDSKTNSQIDPFQENWIQVCNWTWHSDNLYWGTKTIETEPLSNAYKKTQISSMEDTMKLG
jgi:hypothetical protein